VAVGSPAATMWWCHSASGTMWWCHYVNYERGSGHRGGGVPGRGEHLEEADGGLPPPGVNQEHSGDAGAREERGVT